MNISTCKITRTFLTFTTAGVLLCLHGCAWLSPPPPSHGSPEATFKAFVKKMKEGKFSDAYRYFSSDTRKRYKLNHFHGLMNKTRAGKLLQWKIQNWTVKSVNKESPRRVFVTMAPPNKDDPKNRYELIRETTDDGKQYWRIRFFLADELGMPRSDETYLFTPSDEE